MAALTTPWQADHGFAPGWSGNRRPRVRGAVWIRPTPSPMRGPVVGGLAASPRRRHSQRSPVTDQLSSDLASLRIQRDEGPPQRGPWTTILIALVVIGGGAAAAVWGYPRVRGEIFKT